MLTSNKVIPVAASLAVTLHVLLVGSVVGCSRDREFDELHVFIKYRPSSTLYFSSPLGESDPPPGGLSPREAEREAEYVEFVERRGR